MTEREKIIELANSCGIRYRPTPVGTTEMWCWDNAIEAFYHKAQREAFEQAAKLSTEWGNARLDDSGGHACRNLAEAIRQLIKE